MPQTNLYARTREGQHEDWEDLTVPELISFLDTKILMGITILPILNSYYWSTDYCMAAPHVVSEFPRNHFFRILREIHFYDNSTAVPKGQPGYDRAHKVRPIIECCREMFDLVQATQGKLCR